MDEKTLKVAQKALHAFLSEQHLTTEPEIFWPVPIPNTEQVINKTMILNISAPESVIQGILNYVEQLGYTVLSAISGNPGQPLVAKVRWDRKVSGRKELVTSREALRTLLLPYDVMVPPLTGT